MKQNRATDYFYLIIHNNPDEEIVLVRHPVIQFNIIFLFIFFCLCLCLCHFHHVFDLKLILI